MSEPLSSQSSTPALHVYPSTEAKKAIEEYVQTGAWPKPGTLPVCIRLGR